MHAGLRLALHEHHAAPARQAPGERGARDAGADDGDVELVHRSGKRIAEGHAKD